MAMEAERIGRESGVRTVAARDEMRIRVSEKVTAGWKRENRKD